MLDLTWHSNWVVGRKSSPGVVDKRSHSRLRIGLEALDGDGGGD
jgi:hypothetical protein